MSVPFMSDKHALIAERGKRVQEYEESRAYWDARNTKGERDEKVRGGAGIIGR
jgi:hypothetical protein